MTGLGPLVGVGRTAEVYGFGADRVVKLLRPGYPAAAAEAEAAIATLVAGASDTAPRCDGLVWIDGRPGIVYERVEGPTMDARVRTHLGEADGHARRLGSLHAAIHAADGAGLPSQRDTIHGAIERAGLVIPPAWAAAAHARVDRLPDAARLCHGDLHPGNVLLGGRAVVIDWDNACSGSPAADVMRSMFLIRDAAMPEAAATTLADEADEIRGRFSRTYLAAYRAVRPLDRTEVRSWRLPVLVARLAEGIAAERDDLVARIEREIGATVRPA